VNISQSKLRSEKFDNNNNNTNFADEITSRVSQIVNTEYLRRNMVCFKYIIVNNLHKDDNNDDDNNNNNNNNRNKLIHSLLLMC
jgi:hypothetical protein